LLEIFLSLDASVVDSMLLQKLAHSLRFDVLVSFCTRLSSYSIHMYGIHRSVFTETMKAAILGLGMQILDISAQRTIVRQCEMYCSYKYLLIDQKKFVTPTLTPTNRPQTLKNRRYERGYLGNYQI